MASVTRASRRAVLCLAAALLALSPLPAVRAVSPNVVISQVYGGGGNSGATYTHDFIELFNRGTSPASVAGWSVQYASATGTGNIGAGPAQITELPAVTLDPGQYLLVQEAQGSGGTTPLPSPDVTDASPIAMSGTGGKVVLVSTATGLGCNGGSTPCSAAQLALIVDLVGYGSANFHEGSGPTPAPSNTTAVLRAGNGCTDTDNNAADFGVGAPTPRNTTSPVGVCGGPTHPSGVGAANPASVPAGDTVTLTVAVTPGQSPTSTGLVVTANLDAIGGLSAQSFFDDGTHGDAVAGDLTFTFLATVLADTPVGTKSLPVTIVDAQARAGAATIGLRVEPAVIAIHAIQGSGSASPYAGQVVATTGLVTGRKSNGFFLQAPDAEADADPATSEGIFVFTSSAPPAGAAVGNEVRVAGTVQEYSADPPGPPLTEIAGSPALTLLSQGNPLPAPVVLTNSDTQPRGGLEQLERLEGMRVEVESLTVVGPTGGTLDEPNATATSNGVFYGVLEGVERPFREPGIETPNPVPPDPCCLPTFDANPERLRVDSDGQPGAAVLEVAAGDVVTGLVGPLDYAFRTYTLLPDPGTPPAVTAHVAVRPVPEAAPDEVTVASFNLQRFFDTVNDPGTDDAVLTAAAFHGRLLKASLAIRGVLRSPDILGVQEVENLATLQALAASLDADAIAAGEADPEYTAYLEEGNDVGGIDVGFLVKSTRVSVVDVTQEGKDATYDNPVTGQPELLNDRPPLVLRARFLRPDAPSLPVTVIVNHLRSLSGIDDPVQGPRVRAKRRAQAEFLANLIQARQLADPAERIVSVGDYNAYPFNDGYVDGMGTIVGAPTPADEVVLASPDLVDPDLTNLLDLLPPEERYSYVFDGNAEVFDQVLVSSSLLPLATGLHYARANADFPAVLLNDPTRPERASDHDAPVAYFRFPLADLAVTQAASPSPVPSGSTLTSTIVVANAGPDAAEAVELTDALPAGTTFGSLTAPAGWTCTTPPAGGTGGITCTTPHLAAGSSVSLTLALDVPCGVPAGTVVSNTAAVLGQTGDPDPANNTATVTVTVSNPPPVITGIAATPSVLWPPNHQMVHVHVGYSATDRCDVPVCHLGVTSNEPVNTRGDGRTGPDWKVLGPHVVLLRAERSALGHGRIYTITATCADSAGGAATATTHVRVPKSKGPIPPKHPKKK